MTKAKGKEGQQTKGSNKTQGSSQTSSNRDKKNQGAKISEQSSNIKSVQQAGGDCSTGKPVNKPKLKGKTSGDQSRGITCGRVCYFMMAVMIASAASCIAYIYMNESNEQLLGQLDDARKEITHHAFKLLEKLRSYVDAEVVSKEKTEQEKEDLERHEQDAQEKVVRENIAKELAAKEKAAKEQAAKEQAAREQAAKEHVEREQAAREQAGKEQAEREQAAREQAAQAIRVDIPDQEIQDP